MKISHSLSRSILLASFAFLATASFAHAASLSVVFTPEHPSVGTVVRGEVRLTTGTESINVIEGTLIVPDGLQVSSVSAGNSGLSLWPVSPVYVIKDETLIFTGGVPGEVPQNSVTPLFSFTAIAQETGAYALKMQKGIAYKNDGKGTPVALLAGPLSVEIGGTGSTSALPEASDTVAPVFIDVSLGSAPTLFDGKQFVSFAATDSGTGVAYYEVREGVFGSWVRAERYYLVKDQKLSKDIIVRAVDGAGNTTEKKIAAAHPGIPVWLYVALLIGVIAGVFNFMRRKRAYGKTS